MIRHQIICLYIADGNKKFKHFTEDERIIPIRFKNILTVNTTIINMIKRSASIGVVLMSFIMFCAFG